MDEPRTDSRGKLGNQSRLADSPAPTAGHQRRHPFAAQPEQALQLVLAADEIDLSLHLLAPPERRILSQIPSRMAMTKIAPIFEIEKWC